MIEYTVTVNGETIGTRKSPRPYSHAIVTRRKADGPLFVHGFARTLDLATKSAATVSRAVYTWTSPEHFVKGSPVYFDTQVVPVETREIVKRTRVRCNGLNLVARPDRTSGEPAIVWQSFKQCLRDADHGLTPGGARCTDHATTDNGLIRAAVYRNHEEATAEGRRRWAEAHARDFTVESCKVHACPIHVAAEVR